MKIRQFWFCLKRLVRRFWTISKSTLAFFLLETILKSWSNNHVLLGGVYMWKLAPVRVWYRYDIVISYRVYMNGHFMSSNVIVTPRWRHIGLDVEECMCATRSRLPGEWFHAGANSRTAFTWHWNEFLYRNENLAPVQLLGWTRAGMTHPGMRFCACIM